VGSTLPGPLLLLLAGPNGAGKTSFYDTILKPMPEVAHLEFVNADLIAATLDPVDPAAAAEQARLAADARRAQLIDTGTAFCTETVFSHPSKIQLIRQAQQAGFEVLLVFICVDNAALSAARVDFRQRSGLGHSVPWDKVIARYPRAIAYARQAVLVADYVLLLDNSRIATPWQPVLAVDHAKPRFVATEVPDWARGIVEAALAGSNVTRSRKTSRSSSGRAILKRVARGAQGKRRGRTPR